MSPGTWAFVSAPPPPNVPPANVELKVAFQAAGDVSDYDEEKKAATLEVLAAAAGGLSTVGASLKITPASVNIEAIFPFFDASQASQAQQSLTAAMSSTAAAKELFAGVPGGVAIETIPAGVVEVKNKTSQSPPSTAPPTSPPEEGSSILTFLAAAGSGALLLVAIMAFVVCRKHKQAPTMKKKVSTISASQSGRLEPRRASSSTSSTCSMSVPVPSQVLSSPSLPLDVTLSASEKLPNEVSPPSALLRATSAPFASARKQAPPSTSGVVGAGSSPAMPPFQKRPEALSATLPPPAPLLPFQPPPTLPARPPQRASELLRRFELDPDDLEMGELLSMSGACKRAHACAWAMSACNGMCVSCPHVHAHVHASLRTCSDLKTGELRR